MVKDISMFLCHFSVIMLFVLLNHVGGIAKILSGLQTEEIRAFVSDLVEFALQSKRITVAKKLMETYMVSENVQNLIEVNQNMIQLLPYYLTYF